MLKGIPAEHEDPEEFEGAMIEQVLELMPFHNGKIQKVPIVRPRWDTDDLLEDPDHGTYWPGEFDLRVSGKLPIYQLDRTWIAGLGLEGDLLLGLRAGDALRAMLD